MCAIAIEGERVSADTINADNGIDLDDASLTLMRCTHRAIVESFSARQIKQLMTPLNIDGRCQSRRCDIEIARDEILSQVKMAKRLSRTP